MGRVRGAAVLVATIAVCVALVGCTATQRIPVPGPGSTMTSVPTPSNSPSPTAAPDAHLDSQGTARENLAYFNLVNTAFFSANPAATGRAIVDNLVASGFDKSAMQVTPDTTVGGNTSDSIEFSVQMGDECLIGQTSASGYESVVGPALGSGACLVGTTRAITW